MRFRSLPKFARAAVIATAFTVPAHADVWWPALGWQCHEQAGALIAYGLSYDAEGGILEARAGFYVPQDGNWDDPTARELVATCAIFADRAAELERIYLNTPGASGQCGGRPWARYEVRLDGEVVADFVSDCVGRPMLTIDVYGVELCRVGSGSQSTCLRRTDGVLELGLSGNLNERSR